MFQLLAAISTRDLALRQFPAFSISFLIASLFYKFGSFAVECAAFLFTWLLLDALVQIVVRWLPGPSLNQTQERDT
jgi:hypothetical protein